MRAPLPFVPPLLLALVACASGGTVNPALVGIPCDSDADCGGLTCRPDTGKNVGFKQCTAPCDDERLECPGDLAQVCIDGGCMRSCDDETPCPTGTECTRERYCVRIDRPKCVGDIAPCSQQTNCYDVAGCTRCSGTCSTASENECRAVPGCTWSGTCAGLPGCSSATNLSACISIPTCSWLPECTGTSTCADNVFDDAACRAKSGCEAVSDCRGVTEFIDQPFFVCSDFNEANCRKTAGCTFQP